MKRWIKFLNCLMILVLTLVVFGAMTFQFYYKETPCPLCFLQRLMMLAAATGAMMNLRYNVRVAHYGLIILSSILGMAVSLRQIALHICMDFPTFSRPLFGYDLFVWAFMVFYCLLFSTAVLNLLYAPSEKCEKEPLAPFSKIVICFLLFVTFGNAFLTYMQCGFSPCAG